MATSTTIFIALGHRCSTAAILDRCGLVAESFPFDSIVCQLDVIRDCLENGFHSFLEPRHYQTVTTSTVNVVDGVVSTILTEGPSVNRYYESKRRPDAGVGLDLTGNSTYHLQLALTHHDVSVPDDHQAFARRIRRLTDVLAQSRKKVCVYIHPVLGPKDFEQQRVALLHELEQFNAFLTGRYPNVHGLYFLVVKLPEAAPVPRSACLVESDTCSVHVIYANQDFFDAGAPFHGDYAREVETISEIVLRAGLATPPQYKIHFPRFDDPESDSNEMRLTQEGLAAHPQVTLVDRPESADCIVLCQNHLVPHNPFHAGFSALKDRYKEKTVFLDYDDDSGSLCDPDDFRWRLYFKRSCVDRSLGRPMSYGALPVRPTAYCAVDAMCEPPDDADLSRPIDVACLFEDAILDTPYFALARGRLLKFAKRLASRHPQLAMQLGTVSDCGPVGRSQIDSRYKRCLYESKIVLHANPDPWEGDARLWEALAAGALVFVDRMHAPIEHPLIDGEHLIFYDLGDEGFALLEARLLAMLADADARARIAAQGRAFVLEHHRSINRADQIIRALETSRPYTAPRASVTAPLDIVVSIATGYKDVDQYRPFIGSLRRTGCTAPLFLGISDGPEYEAVKKYLLDNAVNYFIVPPITPPAHVVNGYRFVQYERLLPALDFRYALMMDFRDSYFQRDPFADIERFMHDCDLYLMSEFQLLTVGNHPNGVNYRWIEAPFGKEAADAIADREILNTGAILGRKSAVMKLLAAYRAVSTPQGYVFNEQGTLNYLGHTGRLAHCGRIKVERAGISLVNNCGFSELASLREKRPITAEEEARIAFIPRTPEGNLKLYRDHQGWVLDDDGNISYVVHQYDRFMGEMWEFVERLAAFTPPDHVFVASGNRRYQGEKFMLTSREGLRPGAIGHLIAMLKSLPAHKKPLLVLDGGFRRGFAFGYGIIESELLFEEGGRATFFSPTHDPAHRARFLETWGYQLYEVAERDVFLTPEPRVEMLAASEAPRRAERWTTPVVDGQST